YGDILGGDLLLSRAEERLGFLLDLDDLDALASKIGLGRGFGARGQLPFDPSASAVGAFPNKQNEFFFCHKTYSRVTRSISSRLVMPALIFRRPDSLRSATPSALACAPS